MAQARRTKESNHLSGLTIHIGRGLREAALFVLLAIALFLLASMVTYNINDPGWSHTGPRDVIHNAAGKVGAWLSDVLFSLFGYLAFLFPVIIAYSGWLVLRGRKADGELDYHILGIRWAGFFLTLATGCALAALHFSIPSEFLPEGAGGVLGLWLGDELASVLGLLGSSLLLLAILLAGITLFSGLSWLGVMDLMGASMLSTYEWAQLKVRHFIESRQERKEGEESRQKRVEVVKAEQKR
ncbi:MAG TPA: DNA translocase FtsK 4TM domain-containing protein, partial [Gammaproteobacteria bacterium]